MFRLSAYIRERDCKLRCCPRPLPPLFSPWTVRDYVRTYTSAFICACVRVRGRGGGCSEAQRCGVSYVCSCRRKQQHVGLRPLGFGTDSLHPQTSSDESDSRRRTMRPLALLRAVRRRKRRSRPRGSSQRLAARGVLARGPRPQMRRNSQDPSQPCEARK